MPRTSVSNLIATATDVGPRAVVVAHEPAVQKAWSKAIRDGAIALRSIANAVVETRSAWNRTASLAVAAPTA